MGVEDHDVVVYNEASASTKTKLAETSKGSGLVGDRGEVRRSEKRRDREDDRGRSGSESKKSKREDKRKDKALAVPEVMDAEGRNPVEQVADELVGDQAAGGASASLSFGPDYDFSLEFGGRGHHILEDPVACGEYAPYDEQRLFHEDQKNKELTVEVAKWEDEVQRMMGENESVYYLAKSQMKRLRLSHHETATSFEEYAIEKVGAEIKTFITFYEEQGSAPEDAVEKLKEDLDKYLKMAAAHNVEKISEQYFVFPDQASWIPGDELVFLVASLSRVGQYDMGEEWDSAGEEEFRGNGEVDPRPSRVTLKVGGSDPTVSLRGRDREDGSGSSHVSETDEDKDPSKVELRW
ncbi:hypothetical protein AALP_AA1G346200 [Arabis alpina]|uniref:Uncharacterized protein n=1 Tax=Arabis alpina TaxID=50452 RepID=A0A087HSL2_ARAAL|nr:hypothetical protein AALP_AA1G346200 [Arabis alpina]